jgi:hypothetical protein
MNIKRALLRILILALTPAVVACASNKPAENATPTPTPTTEKTPAVEAPKYDGTYTNGEGATLTIRNFAADTGFDFQLKISSANDCNGVDYSDTVEFTEANSASKDGEDVFKLDNGAINFEPSVSMIGMECARVIHVEFAKQK